MARQPRHQLSCQCCGLLFPAINLSAKWCSNACRQWAYHERKRTAALVEPEGLDCRTWQGTAIERRQADGFVNATQMAKANGKHLPHYLANERTRAYIAALAPVVGIPTTDLISVRQGGQPHLQGTWVHPRLAIDLARWISPAFAVWMDGWFLETVAQSKPKFQLPPAAPPLPTGVHVVAGTRREAAQLWWEAISAEVKGALARRLSPAGKTDAGLPLAVGYSWQPRLF
jgi:hypothetical protein